MKSSLRIFLTLGLGLMYIPDRSHSSPLLRRQLQQEEDSYFENIEISEVSLCGCDSCYDKGLSDYETRSGEASCAQRVMDLIASRQLPEEEACLEISRGDEHSEECGPLCDIDLCDERGVLDASETESVPPKIFCGCAECIQDTWLAMAGEFSCGARVSWLVGRGKTTLEACKTVAGEEYADICGLCDPNTCEVVEGDIAMPEETAQNTPGEPGEFVPLADPFALQPEQVDIPLTPEFSLYCFPPYEDRLRYDNVWGKYSIEIKESGNPCGPSDNLFSRETVGLNDDELTLQFRKVGDAWMGSEVRVLLPWDEMPFHYGDYSFSAKSVSVIDSATGSVVDNVLPITMILGLFTWDNTESYAIHENYNHEVDIEISRWNMEGLADVQYLVQPPGDPHKYRFFSGEGGSYSQAPHTYSFEWRPAEIEWDSTAGGGKHQFTYGTQDALDAGQPDYVQCMPADVEVRLNLWNLFGNSAPTGMQDSHMVEVVIDDFKFTPNGLTGQREGGTCSRDCQCEENAVCSSNECSSLNNSVLGDETLAPEEPLKPLPEDFLDTTFGPLPNGNETVTIAVLSEKAQATEPGGEGNMSAAGKAFMILFFLLVFVGLASFFYYRKRRNESERSRVMILCGPSSDSKSKVNECWEHETEESKASSAVEVVIPKKSGCWGHLFLDK